MCVEARRPSMPSTSTIAAISRYQATPAPARLTVAKTRSTPLRAHQPLACRQRKRSAARWRLGKRGVGIGGAPAVGDALEDGVEIGRDPCRAQRLHGLARVVAHPAA